MGNPFPFNHAASIFTPWTGPYKDTALGVSVSSNGIGASEFVRTSNPPGYSVAGLYNVLCGGAQSTAMQFIVNGADDKLDGPFYFILGSAEGNIYLYSFTPVTDITNFASDKIQTIGHVDQINSEVAGFGYSPNCKYLYVVGKNGNIYQYTVSFDTNQKPTITYVSANKSYDSSANGQVSISLIHTDSSSVRFVVTGLCDSSHDGIVYGKSLTETCFLPGSPKGTVAAAFSESTLYAATATQLYMIDQSQKKWKAVWTAPTDVTLTSLGYCSMKSAGAKSAGYTAGLVTIGGFSATPQYENINVATIGNVYGYNPASGLAAALATGISGQVYSVTCDHNEFAFCCNGSTGLTVIGLAPTAAQPTVFDTAIINYVETNPPPSHPVIHYLHRIYDIASTAAAAVTACATAFKYVAGAAETMVGLGASDGAALDALLLV